MNEVMNEEGLEAVVRRGEELVPELGVELVVQWRHRGHAAAGNHTAAVALFESVLAGGAGSCAACARLGGAGRGPRARLDGPGAGRAVELYERAAELGNETAQFRLGVAHANGALGLARSYADAVLSYYFAALPDHPGTG